MKRLFKRLGLTVFMLCICSFIFTAEVGLAAPHQKSRFAKIDGKLTANALQDSRVVGVVVKKEKNQSGQNILYGFTNMQQFHQYLGNQPTAAAKNRSISNFYQHIDMKGARFDVRVGTRVYYVGDRWNDQISSVNPACTGRWTVMYQHRDFRGEGLAIENSNNSCRYYFNLTNYRMSNGQSWNDQVSSMRVY